MAHPDPYFLFPTELIHDFQLGLGRNLIEQIMEWIRSLFTDAMGKRILQRLDTYFKNLSAFPGMKAVFQVSVLTQVTAGELMQIILFLDIFLLGMADVLPLVDLRAVLEVLVAYRTFYEAVSADIFLVGEDYVRIQALADRLQDLWDASPLFQFSKSGMVGVKPHRALYHAVQTIDAYGGLNTVSAQTWEGAIRIIRRFVKGGGPSISEHSLATRMAAASALGVINVRDPRRFRKNTSGESRFANVLQDRRQLSQIDESSELWDLATALKTTFVVLLTASACFIEIYSSANLCTGEFIRANSCFGKKRGERFDDVAYLPVGFDHSSGETVYNSCFFGKLKYLFRLVTPTDSFDLTLVRAYTHVGELGDRRLERRYLTEAVLLPGVVPLAALVGHAHLVPDPADSGKLYAMSPTSMRLYSPQRRTLTMGTGWNLLN